jgi:hypothetical protein
MAQFDLLFCVLGGFVVVVSAFKNPKTPEAVPVKELNNE